jgi:hypothetical protein
LNVTVPDEDKSTLYARRAQRFEAEVEALFARSRLVSNLRGLMFGVAIIATLFAAFGSERLLAAAFAVPAAIAFGVLVVWHSRIFAAEDLARRWGQVNRDAEARCTGRWRDLPDDGERFGKVAHPFADDLDLFGRGSLFQRVSVAHTRFGQEALARLLTAPAALKEIQLRQNAVRVLAPELETRQRLEALALAVVETAASRADNSENSTSSTAPRAANGKDRSTELRLRSARPRAPDPEALLRWAESDPRLERDPLILWGSRLLPPLTLAAIAGATLFGVHPLLWVVPLLLQIALALRASVETTRVFTAVSATEGAFLRYGAMLELLENLALDSTLLESLRERLLSAELRPSLLMKDFRSKVGWFDLRHNGLIHPFANALLLWDIQCVLALERWQRRCGKVVRGWFAALGELEALSSLAALAHDEKDFSFPEVVENTAVFAATGLGHPLIDSPHRVMNDVSLPEPGRALLVTGSNMSGKSTLLRAMGLAAVMAFAGAPVCAARLKVCRCALRTSVRVSDSLEHGVSHFYAEINKLKAVVDATQQTEPVLFLLDEILHGTNSRERQIGARWVLGELLQRGAIGAVSTHDMELCRLPDDLMPRVTMVHFRESVENGKMTFDYKLRPGPVTAGNALRLMQIIGLDVPLD